MNTKGYILTGTSFLLLIPIIISTITLINFYEEENKITTTDTKFKKITYTIEETKRNSEKYANQSLITETNNIITNNKTQENTTQKIIETTNSQLQNYINKTKDITIQSQLIKITSVQNNPFLLEFTFNIKINNSEITYNDQYTTKISIEGLPDPLPFIKLQNYGKPIINNNKINYNQTITKYLETQNIHNTTIYENATSPYIITKCIYEPYTKHNHTTILNNCLNNGFYHESNDGSCFICRLEGKETCPHYGIEHMIQTNQDQNNTLELHVA